MLNGQALVKKIRVISEARMNEADAEYVRAKRSAATLVKDHTFRREDVYDETPHENRRRCRRRTRARRGDRRAAEEARQAMIDAIADIAEEEEILLDIDIDIDIDD